MAQSEEKMKMNVVPDLKFPMLSFSPLATSSPRLTKMKKLRNNQSWHSSDGSDSSGNVTAHFAADVDVSNFKSNNDSTTSMHTALEYVNPGVFNHDTLILVTREELKKAIFKHKLEEDDCDEKFAEFFATVTTERILFTRCRTWAGSLPMAEYDLEHYAKYACQDWYMKKTVIFCQEELAKAIQGEFSYWSHVAPYFHDKGISLKVLKRIFEKNLVRKSTGPRFELIEVLHLLFATMGTDECQSFEYWFRVLDVNSTGVLCFEELHDFYYEIVDMLLNLGVTALSFDDLVEQYCDIVGGAKWTLKAFKKNPKLIGRVINGFVNAYRFLREETDEKTNTERVDDENFGEGNRSRWQRMLDHQYDNFYCSGNSPEVSSTFVKSE